MLHDIRRCERYVRQPHSLERGYKASVIQFSFIYQAENTYSSYSSMQIAERIKDLYRTRSQLRSLDVCKIIQIKIENLLHKCSSSGHGTAFAFCVLIDQTKVYISETQHHR